MTASSKDAAKPRPVPATTTTRDYPHTTRINFDMSPFSDSRIINYLCNAMRDVKIIYSKKSLQIVDSYQINDKDEMMEILQMIRNDERCPIEVSHRSDASLYHEWRAHNLCYQMHILRIHTADVDLNDEPWFMRTAYYIMCALFFQL